MKLAEAVRKKRLDDNLTLHQVAKVSGLNYMTHWKIEQGYTKLTFGSISKLSAWMGITPAEIRQMCEEEEEG